MYYAIYKFFSSYLILSDQEVEYMYVICLVVQVTLEVRECGGSYHPVPFPLEIWHFSLDQRYRMTTKGYCGMKFIAKSNDVTVVC